MRFRAKLFLLVLYDVIAVYFTFILAYLIRFDWNAGSISPELVSAAAPVAVAALLVKISVYIAFRIYNSLWRYASIREMSFIIGAAFVSNSIMVGAVSLFRLNVPRSIFFITFFLDVFSLGGSRFLYRVLRRVLKGRPFRFDSFRSGAGVGSIKRVLVIGGGDAGAIVIRELIKQPELQSWPVAIIDDDPEKRGMKINGVPILGSREDIINVVKKKAVDEIIIAIPSAGRKAVKEISNICSETICKVKILPSITQLIDETVMVQRIRDVDAEDLLERDPVRLDAGEIISSIEDKVVMVTGGGGSIGSELCRQIVSYGPKQLIILDNYENNLFHIHNELVYEYPGADIVPIIASIREKHRIDVIFDRYRPELVYHAAAHKHVPLMELNPTEAVKNNVFGTANVAECADKYRTRRFVLISTDKAVNPTNIMGATKRVAEMVIQSMSQNSDTQFVAVRFGNVLGSNGSVIPFFRRQIELGGPVTVTHPDVTRFFMTVTEAVQLVIQAGAMAKGGEIFVLDMGEPVRIYDLARKLIRLSGFEPDEDIRIEFTGLRPGEKLYEELLMAEEGLKATKNDKIFVARPVFTNLGILRREIEQLRIIITNDPDSLSDYLKEIVPTYERSAVNAD